jgi:phosphohistidine phosphatase
MRTLYLVRHAKASFGDEGGRDFDRPLALQGIGAAARLGKLLAQENLKNPSFVSSPAVRARHTTELILDSFDVVGQVTFDARVYEADLDSLLRTLSEINSEVEDVVLVGHNPGMERLLRFLAAEVRAMPTAAVTKVELESDSWTRLREGQGRLRWLVVA